MRKFALICLVMLDLMAPVTVACTKMAWNTEDFGVFIARSEDFDFDTKPTIEVRASGQRYISPGELRRPATWTSRYSSIMITMLGVTSVEGFNEKGLSISALSLDEDSDEAPVDGDQSELSNILIVPYVLDNYATVTEAVEGLDKLRIVQARLSDTLKAEGHYSIQDSSGDSAVIEIIDGVFKAYHGPQYNVMTNSPAYNHHLAAWDQLKPASAADYVGSFPLPGNTSSEDRFIRAKYMLEALPQPSSYINGLLKVHSALPIVPVSIVGKIVDGKPVRSATQYSTAYNLTQKVLYLRYQYGDTFTQYHVDFNKLNNGKNYHLDAAIPSLAGDVTGRLNEGAGVMTLYSY